MGAVTEEGAVAVDPEGDADPGDAVSHLDLPGSLPDLDVMPSAGEGEVVEVGGSALGPGDDVVDLAVFAGHGAAGDGAVQVSGDQGVLLRGGGEADGAAHREHGAVAGVQHALQPGAGEQVRQGGVGWPAGVLGPRLPG